MNFRQAFIIGLTSALLCAAAARPSPAAETARQAVRIKGNQFVDAADQPLLLHGVNVSALESVAIQGWNAGNPWGGQTGDDTPNWRTIKRWNVNIVRIPLNEASWLGYPTRDISGKPRNPDPGGNYQRTVKNAVADATAAGLYVIVDLHWSAPNNITPNAQNGMADVDHSLDFWKSVAGTLKDNPAVMFELFNEPYFTWLKDGDPWTAWRDGGLHTQYNVEGGPKPYTWQSAGMQQLLTAVRMTGATNVVLVGGIEYAGRMEGWLAHRPSDPLGQMAAVWHAYPNPKRVTEPNYGNAQYDSVKAILKAGIPVIITETGDPNSPGTKGAPFVSKLLPWADENGISYLGWGWNVWQLPDNVLIKDAKGTPTDGYGTYFRDHLKALAAP